MSDRAWDRFAGMIRIWRHGERKRCDVNASRWNMSEVDKTKTKGDQLGSRSVCRKKNKEAYLPR